MAKQQGEQKEKAERKTQRKRRGRGEGSIFFREDRKLWAASISDGQDEKGRRKRVTIFGKTKKIVREKLKEKLGSTVSLDAGKITVAQLMKQWLESKREKTAPRTHEDRERVVNAHLIPRKIGKVVLAKLTSRQVEAYYLEMSSDGVGATTARHAAKALTAALHYARKLGEITVSPATGVTLPPAPKREMLTLTGPQCKALLLASRGRPCYPIIALALGSGLRQGELLALSWEDIDLDKGTLTVRRSLCKTKAGGFELRVPKTQSSRRTIVLPAFAIEVMKEHRAAREAAGMLDVVCFTSRAGLFMPRSDLYAAFKRVCKRTTPALPAGLRFHDLRHTHASLLLSQGQSLRAVSNRLGHVDPALTLRVYAHVLPADDQQLADGVARIIG